MLLSTEFLPVIIGYFSTVFNKFLKQWKEYGKSGIMTVLQGTEVGVRERKRRKMVYKGEMKDEQTYRRRDGDQK